MNGDNVEGKAMEQSLSVASVRAAVAHLLEKKGYTVKDISTGSGVPRLSRLEIKKEGKTEICAVKVTTQNQGRISFTRNPNGTYKVLSDSDRVIYACPVAGDGIDKVAVSMFEGEVIKQAFDANYEVRRGTDQEKLPMWLSPEMEGGARFIGSGFKDKAIWSDVVPLFIHADSSTLPTISNKDVAVVGIMERIKGMLSEHMGVHPDQLEVDVRVKL